MIGDRFKKIRGCCNLVILVRLIIFDPLDQKNMRCTIEKAAGSDSMFIFSIHILEGKTLTMVGWSYVCLFIFAVYLYILVYLLVVLFLFVFSVYLYISKYLYLCFI